MLKFAIIGPSTMNTQDLFDAILDSGHQATVIKLSEIVFATDDGVFTATYDGGDICEFDVIFFRGYERHLDEAKLLAEMLVEENKTIIEETLARRYVSGKMEQAKRLFQRNIRHPKTFQADSTDGWRRILEKMEFPIIAKPTLGCKGRGINRFDTLQAAQEFFSANLSGYLAQQYFPIMSDFRIFVVGGEIVGGFQRFIQEGQYKSNIRGTRGEKIDISDEMKKIAVASSEAMGYEVAGVDLFEYKGELYIIEVNVTPQWEKFKLVTGINPAEHMVQYAIEKHFRNHK